MFTGLAVIFATLRLAHLQVLSQHRDRFTGTCDGHLPLGEYGSFNSLSTDGVLVHSYYADSPHLIMARIINVSVVCEVSGGRRNTVSTIASVVMYECTGSWCPNNSVITEMIHLDCRSSGSYVPYAISIGNIRTETSATLSTPLAKQCGACREPTVVIRSDPITHCLPCHEDCIGLRLCRGNEPQNCCNYYYKDNCVISCPDGLTPNSRFDCDCGEISGINHALITYSDSQFVDSVVTLTCDIGNGFVPVLNGVVFDDFRVQRTCTPNQGWSQNGSGINCIPRVFLEYPSVPPLAPAFGTQIVLACRVVMEYRVVWIVEIPGVGRLESEYSAAISALQEEGFATETTSAQNHENRLTITGSLRNNLATVQCAAVDVRNTKTRYVGENIITVKFYGPPTGLTATENGRGSLILSWSAQPAVEGLSYTVIITNLNDLSGEPMRVRGIRDHQYTFTRQLEDATYCSPYKFQVISVSSEGIEGPSATITSDLPSFPSPPLVEQSFRKMARTLVLRVTMNFVAPCSDFPPHNYTLVLTDKEGVTTTITNSYPLTSNTTVVADVENVERKLRYTVYVVVTNQFGESAKSAIADQVSAPPGAETSLERHMDEIIGSVVSSVLLIGMIVAGIIVLVRRKNRREKKEHIDHPSSRIPPMQVQGQDYFLGTDSVERSISQQVSSNKLVEKQASLLGEVQVSGEEVVKGLVQELAPQEPLEVPVERSPQVLPHPSAELVPTKEPVVNPSVEEKISVEKVDNALTVERSDEGSDQGSDEGSDKGSDGVSDYLMDKHQIKDLMDKDQMENQMEDQIEDQMKDQMKDRMKDQMKDRMKDQMKDQIKDQIEEIKDIHTQTN